MQFARMAGAQVVASVGSAAKAAAAEALGARAINYRDTDIGAVLAAEYPGGLDWVVDGVGGELQETLIGHMAPGATLLQIGYISEYPHTGARRLHACCTHAVLGAVQGLPGKLKTSCVGRADLDEFVRYHLGWQLARTNAHRGGIGMAESAAEPLRCTACGAAVEWRWCCAGTVPRERPGRPRNDETMWGGAPVDLGDGRTLRSDIWPKVLYSENGFHCHRLLWPRLTAHAVLPPNGKRP